MSAPAVNAQTAKTKIDVHHHFLPQVHREALTKHKMGAPKWSPQMSLEDMDKSGIATSVLSQVQPGTWYGDALAFRNAPPNGLSDGSLHDPGAARLEQITGLDEPAGGVDAAQCASAKLL